jgi:hypothetical protein
VVYCFYGFIQQIFQACLHHFNSTSVCGWSMQWLLEQDGTIGLVWSTTIAVALCVYINPCFQTTSMFFHVAITLIKHISSLVVWLSDSTVNLLQFCSGNSNKQRWVTLPVQIFC